MSKSRDAVTDFTPPPSCIKMILQLSSSSQPATSALAIPRLRLTARQTSSGRRRPTKSRLSYLKFTLKYKRKEAPEPQPSKSEPLPAEKKPSASSTSSLEPMRMEQRWWRLCGSTSSTLMLPVEARPPAALQTNERGPHS